jgi:hypothetical protein
MKKTFSSAFIVAALAASSSFAAVTTDTFGPGEILVSFFTGTSSTTGVNKNLLVNLGSYSQFDNNDGATIPFSATIIADLAATYGNNWNSRTDITWLVTGTTGSTAIAGVPRNTIFATSPRSNIGDAPVSINSNSQSALGTVVTNITAVAGSYDLNETTSNSSVTVVVDASDTNSVISRYTGSTPQFSFLNNNDTQGSNVSDFYALVPTSPLTGTTLPSGAAVDSDGIVFTRGTNYLGYFTLTSSGFSFTAIPEPSSYAALFGVLALGCVAVRRRSRA